MATAIPVGTEVKIKKAWLDIWPESGYNTRETYTVLDVIYNTNSDEPEYKIGRGKDGWFMERSDFKVPKDSPIEIDQVTALEDQKPKKGFTDSMSELLSSIDKEVGDRIEVAIESEMTELREMVKKNQKLEVKVGDQKNIVTGIRHKQLDDLILATSLGLNILMVGMAGTGKTHAAEQTAEALGLPFYAMSVGAQTAKSDIIGYMSANGDYIKTHFREAYENGGVFLMDEIDAGNANVLIQVNAALSNGVCAFPDKMVKRHEDFKFIASANTYGNGANRQYVGRNQLDAATIDRFTVLDWLIDDQLEEGLAVGKDGIKWYHSVLAARKYVADHGIRALVSPRATQKGSKLIEAGLAPESAIDATVLASVPDDKKQDVKNEALKAFK